MLTFVTALNIVIYLLLLMILSLFIYYIAYRWVKPELTQQPFHRVVQFFTTSLMVSAGIGIWFFQNQKIFPNVVTILNQISGRTLLQYPPVLYPVFTFLLFLVVLTPMVWAALHLLVKPLKIQQDTSKTIQLVAYLLLLVSATTCIFSTDFLEISPGQESDIYGGGTEDYVRYRVRDVELSFIEDLRIHGGFLYGRGPNPTDPVHDYLSVSGFYGTLLKLIQTTTKIDPEIIISNARIFFASATALVLTTVSFFLKKEIRLSAIAAVFGRVRMHLLVHRPILTPHMVFPGQVHSIDDRGFPVPARYQSTDDHETLFGMGIHRSDICFLTQLRLCPGDAAVSSCSTVLL